MAVSMILNVRFFCDMRNGVESDRLTAATAASSVENATDLETAAKKDKELNLKKEHILM